MSNSVTVELVDGKLVVNATRAQASVLLGNLKELSESLPSWINNETRCHVCSHWGDHSNDQGMNCPRHGFRKYKLDWHLDSITLDKDDPSSYCIRLGDDRNVQRAKMELIRDHWDEFVAQLQPADEIVYKVNMTLASRREVTDIAEFMQQYIRRGCVSIVQK